MENITELWNALYKIEKTDIQSRKEKAFEIFDLFRNLPPKERSLQPTVIAVCGAATVIASIVEKGLIDRVLPYFNSTEKPLPEKAQQVLTANLRRMQGF